MPENRVLIVTGASSGIGRALAIAAAARGFRILAVARRAQRLAELAGIVTSGGGTCLTIAGDVTARDVPARVVERAQAAFGRIDALVNNAGRGAYGALLEQTDAAIEAQWQLNVAAPLRFSRAALPALEASHGTLVFVGSGIARVPLPNWGAYAPAKAAIRAAAVQLRRELSDRNVAVTYVDPGVVDTEFHSVLGVERNPGFHTSTRRVAGAILRGIERRRAVVNAIPWQTAFATLGEWSGTLADPFVTRYFAAKRHAGAGVPHAEAQNEPSPARESGNFETALEPVARRMDRVKLPASFLREALVPGTILQLGPLAMRWAGMPNKNERAVLEQALQALAQAGYLEATEEESWRVIRAAD